MNTERPSAGRLVAVSVGQKVIFRNTGSRAGGIYSVSDGNDFNLPLVPPGGTATYVVASAGPIEILTDPARNPLAELCAAPSRWVLPARSGAMLVFNNIPPGQYRLVSWHLCLPGTQTSVILSINAVTDATIKVGVQSTFPRSAANKSTEPADRDINRREKQPRAVSCFESIMRIGTKILLLMLLITGGSSALDQLDRDAAGDAV